MKIRRKALVLGDYDQPPYHPLAAVEEEFAAVWGDEWELIFTDDYRVLAPGGLSGFDLCVSYTDCWFKEPDPAAAGLLGFVAGGGGLLVVHCGISLQQRRELSPMMGAYYKGHGPYGRLAFAATPVPHPITEGIEPFEMDEEPYRFDLYPFAGTSVLLEYRDAEGTWPAVWAHPFGLGKVAYVQIGHHRPSFAVPEFRRLLANGARWCASRD
jgi:hypothetical protein